MTPDLRINLDSLPPALGIAVSGGADSVALLRLLLVQQSDRRLVIVHLNHQLRGDASDADEQFVRNLAEAHGLPVVIRRISEMSDVDDLPTNPSAKYRALRLIVYREAMQSHGLDAIALAHHADDQAETVLLRLVRGGGLGSLRAMRERSILTGVPIIRPLLAARRADLRAYLESIGQAWREDASNASPTYRRNVVRQVTERDPSLTPLLCDLASRASTLSDVLDGTAPSLDESFASDALNLPSILSEHAARRWLTARGADTDDVSASTCKRLIEQATNPAAPARQHYPGGIVVRRRGKRIFVDSPPMPAPAEPDPNPRGSA